MSTSAPGAVSPQTWRFGRFALDAAGRTLREDGQPVALGARAFDLLAALVARAGTLVTKRELLALAWPGLVVEENNLQVQVSTLRKLLGASALATIPGRGYRFDLPVVRGEAALLPEPAEPEASTAPPPCPTNLPGRLPPLYGRAGDVADVETLLREHAMVTIVGAGGIGKTRVGRAVAMAAASNAAGAYPDGVWWVELAALTDATLVPATIAHALGARLAPDRPPSDALWSLLAPQAMLLVLDNCEHLSDAVASLVEMLRAHAPRVSILVTSQETLKVGEEHVYRVGPLAVPVAGAADVAHCGAVELFVARAHAADPHFALTPANAPGVGEICRRLDGIPLAIEFAAARVPLLGVEGLRVRLDERFNVLTGGSRVVLRRHQTLRATLEWSHSLLTPEEQTVFRRLAVFAGGFTLEAAQHVAHDDAIDPWTALDHLGALVDKSLVLAEGDPVPRYRLLETTRAYALERLAEARETQAMLRRHAEAMLATLQRFVAADWHWRVTRTDVGPGAAELDNLRAALAWADTAPEGRDLVVQLAAASFAVWWSAPRFAEGLARCLAVARHVDDRVGTRDAALFWLTVARLGNYSLRRESYDAAVRAAEMYRELGDDRCRFDALTCAVVQGSRFAAVEEVEAALAEATSLERPEWPARQRSGLEFARCWCLARQGRAEEALAAAHRQVAINREGGVEVAAMFATSNVTAMELMLGRIDAALEHSRDAIARLDALGARQGAGHLYRNAAMALALMGRMDEALATARTAHGLLTTEGDEYLVLPTLALVAASKGRLDDAARVAGFHAAAQARLVRVPEPLGAAMLTRLAPLLAKLPDAELSRLSAEGAALRPDDAFRIGFGDGMA